VRASVVAESAGFPSVSIVASGFVGMARAVASALGVKHLRIVEFPGVLMTESAESIRNKVTSHIVVPLVDALTTEEPS